jgi:tRNA(Ile2)-agmatinylcytidine synthase
MRCLVGLDDTDSSRGSCTTYIAYRIASDLGSTLRALPYPRLVRLNPNVPFKTRGNAAVCLPIETSSPRLAYERICSKVSELSDVEWGANSGVVFLQDASKSRLLLPLYKRALSGLVSPHSVRRLLAEVGAWSFELGNGMGVVGAASSLAFDEALDHTYELIAYRRPEACGTARALDADSVREMELATWPHTFNSYDHQKRKALIAPHGPDPVFLGIRGDSPRAVLDAYDRISLSEALLGHMVYLSNQHTDAHLQSPLEWKAFSSGWAEGTASSPSTGPGGHVYFTLWRSPDPIPCAVYEPTGDLRRAARLLSEGDRIKAYGGVRRPSSAHPKVLNVERIDVLSPSRGGRLARGTYIASPRANRHLTKPFARYGRDAARRRSPAVEGWLAPPARPRGPAGSPR